MKRMTIEVGSYGVNCSVLSENGRAWIVDPGAEASRIVKFLSDAGLVPAAVLLTHGHFDHIGALPEIRRAFPDIPVCLGAADHAMIGHPMNQCPPDYPPVGPMTGLSAPDAAGPDGVEAIPTPGHTPGGICYYFPKDRLLLSGDTLFAGSVGRTDFPGGDMMTLMDSLKKLVALPDDTLVVPGHGPETTIGLEKRRNPFLVNG